MRAKEAGKLIGVSASTIRKYSNEGRLKYKLNPAGHRIYTEKDIQDFLGSEKTITKAYYARSSSGNKELIKSQLKELTQTYGEPEYTYTDSGSGLNDNRTGLKKLIKDAKDNKYNELYVTYEDRLARFGTKFIIELLEQNGVTVIIKNDKVKYSAEEELMQDFMSLIASFSGKFYRLRSKDSQQKLLDKARERLCDNA